MVSSEQRDTHSVEASAQDISAASSGNVRGLFAGIVSGETIGRARGGGVRNTGFGIQFDHLLVGAKTSV